jgi:hypothetical protein
MKVMTANRIAVIDFETTGIFPYRSDRVVEIGVVIIDDYGNVQSEYETLVNPCRDIGPTRLHGISAADILNAPCFEEIAGDVIEMLSGWLHPASIPSWLRGSNAHLGDRSPAFMIRHDHVADVIAALEAEKAGAYA